MRCGVSKQGVGDTGPGKECMDIIQYNLGRDSVHLEGQ